jgi:hypothetical protein
MNSKFWIKISFALIILSTLQTVFIFKLTSENKISATSINTNSFDEFRNDLLNTYRYDKSISKQEGDLKLIQVVPSNSCNSCVDYDLNVLSNLNFE